MSTPYEPGERPRETPSEMRDRPDERDRSGGDETLLWIVVTARLLVYFVYAVILAVLVVLTLGFVLRLFGASTDAAFTRWVYRNDDRIMEPFRGMFPTETVGDASVVDFSLLFGMIFYTIIAIVLHLVITWLARQITKLERGEPLWR